MAKIFVTTNKFDADFKVRETNNRNEADLLIYEDKAAATAKGDARWFFANSKFGVDKQILMTTNRHEADLVIFKVPNYNAAEWRNKSHSLIGKIG